MGNKGGKVILTEEIVENISRSSGIETHKIRAECQNFLKDHPRGNMNRRDFRKFLKIALPKIDVKKMEENLFRMYDTNMDGVISMQVVSKGGRKDKVFLKEILGRIRNFGEKMPF